MPCATTFQVTPPRRPVCWAAYPHPGGRMDWAALRDEFPGTGNWAFLDHAAVAPLSGRARRALLAWADYMTEQGGVRIHQWVRRVEEVRQLAARLLNADADDVAFVKNTSEGIGLV